ncbi:Pre-mRNA-splicing factor rse-1 [Metarhizium acridum CQMa 102]|uniref:Pre-mRNA-splicing factor rse-1 n=1 Tax=Metarhizium acridum (strain CQMa 102) TaxID=655827 RepID=E9DWD9_METAQ|nr:Pre-mRNA-splicing factor rse-1 [Metarhizium acridum CQMa 102]EFY91989.1 Pre-mRNA-splicing factor rse-1 [Metarhizium acridum CQMa 102]
MATTSNMFLYSLTIQPPTSVTQAIIGQFSGTKEQQIVTASGPRLNLYRPDINSGKIIKLLSHDVFGIIRSIAAFRLAGSSKDYIILASDSGRIAIVEYAPTKNSFSRIHLATFGKSGVRRVIPGQYLAADPKGRACLIASIEKNKLVYVLNRNAEAELTISSPLEAHKHGILVFSVVSLDVGYATPVFAALEADYTEAEQDDSAEVEIQLVYYELDLGLNHVVRKWSEVVDPTSSLLFQVPGGSDGPSGVLVCGEENVTYRHSNQEAFRVPIPRRRGATEDPQRRRIIVSGVMHKLKGSTSAFFFLLQTDDGDLFKVTLDMAEDADGNLTGEVTRIKIKYFDTIPVSNSICIMKSGFLFTAGEFGNYQFYQFEKLGDDDDETEFTSDDFPTDYQASYHPVYFHPRPLENLTLVESVSSMAPLMDCKILTQAGEDISQIYAACGNGARSTLRILRHGLEVNELVASELPGTPSAVWTTKLTQSDDYDAYIILTFLHDTMVLSVGETVTQVTDSGFITTVATLAVQQIGKNSLFQVYSKGIRHIQSGQFTEWPVPQHRTIVAAATNERQVAIALSSGEIVYFEVDEDGSLAEFDERKEIGSVTSLGLGPVPEGRLRSPFLAVGCDDCTVRILSLEPESTLEKSENNTLDPSLCAQLLADTNVTNGDAKHLPPGDFGLPRGKGRWASCVSIINPVADAPSVLDRVHLEGNEAGVSAAVVPFTSQDGESFLIIGTGKDMIVNPRQSSEGFIHVYRFHDDGRSLEFIHKTKVEEPPTALLSFHGRLLAGIGKTLRIYDLGMRQLLRKAQADISPQHIVSLQSQGFRIVVGDVQHGVTMVVYNPVSNKLLPFVDDTIARWTTCLAMADYESVAGGDKFGNIWIVRCPDKASAEADEPGSDVQLSNGQSYLHGAAHRLQLMAHMFVQDIPTSICKTSLVVGGQDVLLWSGLQGTIGVLIPLVTRETADFFQTLEMHMRNEDPPLAGRDHLMYRGYHVPVKGVIDGDLCERFSLLSREKKQMIAGELDRSVREVERRISDVRIRSVF